MATDWRWYFGDRDYYLRDKTEELASELAAAASRERSERVRLAQQQGTLEERLNRLTSDVQRLVELSDLRDELDFFADNEAVRRRVRTALVAMELLGPSGRPMAPPSAFDLRDDTVDYWLGPATRSLPRLLGGAEPGADPDVVEARRRDPERTDRFLALVLTLAGEGARAGSLVPALLGPVPDGQLSGGQRALWLAAAGGGLGPDARGVVADWLRDQVAAGPEASAVDVERWQASARGLGGGPEHAALLKRLPGPVAQIYEGPLQAAWGLEAVMALMTAADAAWSEPPARGAIDDATRARLQGALVALVDEGSPAEAPLLRRAEALRRHLRTEGEAATGSGPELPDPDAPAGLLADLLVADALPPPDGGAARPGGGAVPAAALPAGGAAPAETGSGPLTALAWHAGITVLAPIVRSLAAAAAGLPPAVEPYGMTVGAQVVSVGPDPLAPGQAEAAAQAAAEASYPAAEWPAGPAEGRRPCPCPAERAAAPPHPDRGCEHRTGGVAGRGRAAATAAGGGRTGAGGLDRPAQRSVTAPRLTVPLAAPRVMVTSRPRSDPVSETVILAAVPKNPADTVFWVTPRPDTVTVTVIDVELPA